MNIQRPFEKNYIFIGEKIFEMLPTQNVWSLNSFDITYICVSIMSNVKITFCGKFKNVHVYK